MTLKINDVFWTFQGEGQFAGHRALFVRMPFCNYSCPWCDTEYNSFKKWELGEFVEFAQQEPARFAVITGGEPMMNKQTPNVACQLQELGFYVSCETNGSKPITDGIDFATVSPKRFTQKGLEPFYIHPEVMEQASEFKYVVDDHFDFSILDRHDVNDGRRYSLSPEFNKMRKNLEKIFSYIKENPQWKISLQTHKWINVP